MTPKIENESIREIIGSHVFYMLTIILVGISTAHGIPEAVWKVAGTGVIFLVIGSIGMAFLSMCYAIKCHAIVNLANEIRERLYEWEVEDEEEKP